MDSKADAPPLQAESPQRQSAVCPDQSRNHSGIYNRVNDFIREWRGREGRASHAFVSLSFELGEAFHFDCSLGGLVIGGIQWSEQVSHMKLCASRAFWLLSYPSQGHEMMSDAQPCGSVSCEVSVLLVPVECYVARSHLDKDCECRGATRMLTFLKL